MLGGGGEGVSDSLGRYVLRLPESGLHTLELSHPRLSLYRVPPRQEVETSAGQVRRLDIAIPPMPELASRLCPGPAPDDAPRGAVAIVGRVLCSRGDSAAPYTAVRLAWKHQVRLPGVSELRFREETVTLEATADADGYFVLCQLPADTALELSAQGPDGQRVKQRLRLQPNRVEEALLHLPYTVSGIPYPVFDRPPPSPRPSR